MPIYEYDLKPRVGEDKIEITTQQTAGYFPGGAGTLSNTLIHSASVADSNEAYFYGISNKNPTGSGAETIFTVAYGHRGGSGSLVETNTVGESRGVYTQWAQTLLTPAEVTGGFMISKAGTTGKNYSTGLADHDVYVLVGKRSLYKERLNKKNWTVAFSGSKPPLAAGADKLILTDDSNTVAAVATPAGPRYNIVSGSSGTVKIAASARTFGWFYPDVGTMVFSATELSASIPGPTGSKSVAAKFKENWTDGDVSSGTGISSSAGFAPNTTTSYDGNNALRFINALRTYSGNSLQFRSEENVNSVAYICRLKAGQANFSNNLTAVSGSGNYIRNRDMVGNPQTFITGIGLIDAKDRLIAIAKLSTPVQKNFSSEATFKVKLSY